VSKQTKHVLLSYCAIYPRIISLPQLSTQFVRLTGQALSESSAGKSIEQDQTQSNFCVKITVDNRRIQKSNLSCIDIEQRCLMLELPTKTDLKLVTAKSTQHRSMSWSLASDTWHHLFCGQPQQRSLISPSQKIVHCPNELLSPRAITVKNTSKLQNRSLAGLILTFASKPRKELSNFSIHYRSFEKQHL